MVAFKSLLIAAFALSSSALAAFEPLNANDMFARSPEVQFEPLERAPSASRRSHAQHFPRAHSTIARRQAADAVHAPELANVLTVARSKLNPASKSVKEIVAKAKVEVDINVSVVIGQLQPLLGIFKQTIHESSQNVQQISSHPKPAPSAGSGGGSGGSNPGASGCSDLLKELIELLEEVLTEVKGLSQDIPELNSIIDGFVVDIDTELTDLVSGAETLVVGITVLLKQTLVSLQGTLQSLGLTGLLNLVLSIL